MPYVLGTFRSSERISVARKETETKILKRILYFQIFKMQRQFKHEFRASEQLLTDAKARNRNITLALIYKHRITYLELKFKVVSVSLIHGT